MTEIPKEEFKRKYDKIRRAVKGGRLPYSDDLLYLLETARRLYEVGDEVSAVRSLRVVAENTPGIKLRNRGTIGGR